MPNEFDIEVISDTATPALDSLQVKLSPNSIKRAVGRDCTLLVQDHLRSLGPNKRGWPSTGFYAGAAKGTSWDMVPEGIVIRVDNDNAPGAMRQRFHGGPIDAKDKLLTIPARAEFYGHRATEFDNLKFMMFRSGAKALVIREGGTGLVNFGTGRSRNVKGAGVRSAGMVAFWLVEHVDQDADPDVIPSEEALADTAIAAVIDLVESKGGTSD
jgi:hypothetical protein